MSSDAPTWPSEFADQYRRAGYWQGQTFGDWLHGLADRHGDATAIVSGDGTTRWSYRQLDERADRLTAGLIDVGISAGDRVVVQLPNVPEFFEVVFALFRIGALPVFALPAHRRAEIGYFLQFTEAVAYVIPDRHGGFDHAALAAELRPHAPALQQVLMVATTGAPVPADVIDVDTLRGSSTGATGAGPTADEVAFLQLSGGSTGLPKLIPRTHDDYLYSVRASAEICQLTPETVYLTALPVAHNFPLSSPGVLGVLHAGGTVVLAPGPAPADTFALIERERVTLTALVPPLAALWLDAAAWTEHDLSSLETLQVGGAKLAEEVACRVRPALGCELQQVFGMAEGLVNYVRSGDADEVALTTQGRPISPDDEILIVDDADVEVPAGHSGHLLTRGPYTIRGYWRADAHNATAFTPDGFYRTGDIVRQLPTGHLVVEGRAKDQINRGGEKIAAEEVENHLLAHPAILDAAVVAIPDPILGERSCAFLVARGQAPKATEIRAFIQSRGLAAYKIPDRVEFLAEFPATGVGKTSRKDLRTALALTLHTGE